MTDYFDLVTNAAKQNAVLLRHIDAVKNFTEAFEEFIKKDDELMREEIECFKAISALLKNAIGGRQENGNRTFP